MLTNNVVFDFFLFWKYLLKKHDFKGHSCTHLSIIENHLRCYKSLWSRLEVFRVKYSREFKSLESERLADLSDLHLFPYISLFFLFIYFFLQNFIKEKGDVFRNTIFALYVYPRTSFLYKRVFVSLISFCFSVIYFLLFCLLLLYRFLIIYVSFIGHVPHLHYCILYWKF